MLYFDSKEDDYGLDYEDCDSIEEVWEKEFFGE